MRDDLEVMRPTPPMEGVAQMRASLWCGTDGHHKEVVATRTFNQLNARERNFRCPQCGLPDCGAWQYKGGHTP